jgi:hypothetical protein
MRAGQVAGGVEWLSAGVWPARSGSLGLPDDLDGHALCAAAARRGPRAGRRALYQLFRAVAEDHIYQLACENNLAIVIRKTGDHIATRVLSDDVIPRIVTALGDTHPYTACAWLNSANDLRAIERPVDARAIDERMYNLLRDVLGRDHIDTVGAMRTSH